MPIDTLGETWREVEKTLNAAKTRYLAEMLKPTTDHDRTQFLRGCLAQIEATLKLAEKPVEHPHIKTPDHG